MGREPHNAMYTSEKSPALDEMAKHYSLGTRERNAHTAPHRIAQHRISNWIFIDFSIFAFPLHPPPSFPIGLDERSTFFSLSRISHLALSVTTSNRLLLQCLIVVDHRKFCAPSANYSARRIFQSWTESVVRRHPATIAPTTTCIMFVCVFVHFSFLFWLLALYVFCFFFSCLLWPYYTTTPFRCSTVTYCCRWRWCVNELMQCIQITILFCVWMRCAEPVGGYKRKHH